MKCILQRKVHGVNGSISFIFLNIYRNISVRYPLEKFQKKIPKKTESSLNFFPNFSDNFHQLLISLPLNDNFDTIIDFSCYRLHKLIQLKYLYSSNAMVSLKCDTFKRDLKMQLISHHPSLARSLALGFAYEPVIGPRAVLISQFRSNGVPNERVVLIDPSQLFNKYLNDY